MVALDLPDLSLPKTIHSETERASDRLEISKAAHRMLDQQTGTVHGDGVLRPGTPALEAFPSAIWARLAGRFWRDTPGIALGYGDPAGDPRLREALSAYLAAFRGLDIAPEHLIITSGAQQAIDLIARTILEPGDTALVEEPCYPGLRGPLAAAGAELADALVDEEGLNVHHAREKAPTAKLLTVTPTHQFPLGTTLSLPRRRALIDWARDPSGPWIVEDDYDGEFRYSGKPVPPLKALDGTGRVFYVGTMSKVLAPALRIGFIAAPPVVAATLTKMRSHLDRQPPMDTQRILALFLEEGHMGGHLRRMRTLYRERRDALAEALARKLDAEFSIEIPETGLSLIVDLPQHLPDRRVAEAGVRFDISPAALSGYYAGEQGRNGLLLGFANLPRSRANWAAEQVERAVIAAS